MIRATIELLKEQRQELREQEYPWGEFFMWLVSIPVATIAGVLLLWMIF